MEVTCTWRGAFSNAEVNALHASAFGHGPADDDWEMQVARHSLGWVAARSEATLVGFVNVVWDGAVHAWLQDLMVAEGSRGQGIGTRLAEASREAARDAGCDWLHVDFDDELRPFYVDACGFTPAAAGLIALR